MTMPEVEAQPQDREPRSWQKCIELLLELGSESMIYRGQNSYVWPLWTSLREFFTTMHEKRHRLVRIYKWNGRQRNY